MKKRIVALLTAVLMVLSMCGVVYADGNTIDKVEITIAAPIAGTTAETHPGTDKPVGVFPDIKTSVAGKFRVVAAWLEPGTYIEGGEPYVFEEGKTYRCFVTLENRDKNGNALNYVFADDAKATVIGGKQYGETVIENMPEYNYSCLVVHIDVKAVAPTPTKKTQTITASNQTKTYGDAAFNLKAKTSGDGALSYKSGNPSVAQVNSKGQVTIKGAGTAKITIKAAETDSYNAASRTITVKVNKAKNPVKVTANKTVVSYAKVKKAAQTIPAKKAFTVKNRKGTVSYKQVTKNSSIKVSSSGKVTIKKGTKKNIYSIKVKVTDTGGKNYKPVTKQVTLKIQIK